MSTATAVDAEAARLTHRAAAQEAFDVLYRAWEDAAPEALDDESRVLFYRASVVLQDLFIALR
jgi:NAD dependent epimerase/dehydratase family enzyme